MLQRSTVRAIGRWSLFKARGKAMRSRSVLVRWLLVLGILSLLVALLSYLTGRDGVSTTSNFLVSLTIGPAMAVLSFLLIGPAFERAYREESLLAVGRCPACEYTLRGIEPQTDGCVICPECAAAWRLSKNLHKPSSASTPTRPQRTL